MVLALSVRISLNPDSELESVNSEDMSISLHRFDVSEVLYDLTQSEV